MPRSYWTFYIFTQNCIWVFRVFNLKRQEASASGQIACLMQMPWDFRRNDNRWMRSATAFFHWRLPKSTSFFWINTLFNHWHILCQCLWQALKKIRHLTCTCLTSFRRRKLLDAQCTVRVHTHAHTHTCICCNQMLIYLLFAFCFTFVVVAVVFNFILFCTCFAIMFACYLPK